MKCHKLFPSSPGSLLQIQQLVRPLYQTFGKSYRAAVGAKLSKYGLRFDDLQDPLKDEVRRRAFFGVMPNRHSLEMGARLLVLHTNAGCR